MKLNEHDIIVEAISRILEAFGFRVERIIKGRKRSKIKGNSKIAYYPDIVAFQGPLALVADVRTRGQRGTRDEIDRGAIQLLQAELDDLRATLKRPHGMIISPHGIAEDAKQLAEHLGILVIQLPVDTADKVIELDPIKHRQKLIEVGKKHGITFGILNS